MLRTFTKRVLLPAMAGASMASAAEAQGAGALTAERLTGALDRPVFLTSAPGTPGVAYVAEAHTGAIRELDLATGALSTFFTLPGGTLSTGNEQGLLGLAFDPDYAQNGRFYVNFTDAGGDTVVRRYAPGTEGPGGPGGQPAFVGTDLLTIDQPQSNHNGGWIGFNPAAPAGQAHALFIAVGDGGSSNDPQNNAQTTTNLLGSILRIDVSGDTYTSPADNPFAGTGDPGRDEIFAYGVRNPYRASFDRVTGDLYIGDVGQNAREEIDLIAAGTSGQNFGWRIREGDIATPGVGGPLTPDLVDPIYDYDRVFDGFGGQSVTGGVLYRGPVAELQGLYLFADFVSQQIWSLDPANPDASVANITELLAGAGQTLGGVSSFGEDLDGNVYVVNLGGEVFRIVPEPGTLAAVGVLGFVAAARRVRERA